MRIMTIVIKIIMIIIIIIIMIMIIMIIILMIYSGCNVRDAATATAHTPTNIVDF